jgi:hypothetical protein
MSTICTFWKYQERAMFELPEEDKMRRCESHRLLGNFLFSEGKHMAPKAAEQYKLVRKDLALIYMMPRCDLYWTRGVISLARPSRIMTIASLRATKSKQGWTLSNTHPIAILASAICSWGTTPMLSIAPRRRSVGQRWTRRRALLLLLVLVPGRVAPSAGM